MKPLQLNLNLKKKWFDLIFSGKKTEEYREIKPFFLALLTTAARDLGVNGKLSIGEAKEICAETLELGEAYYDFRKFETVLFSNGYAKNRRQFEFELLSIRIDTGKPEWGATPHQYYFVLQLGKIISCNFQK